MYKRQLADSRKEWANDFLSLNEWSIDAETMLRQQQADLKDADKYALELERLYEDAKAEIEVLKDKLMLAIQSLEIVEGWIKK